MSLFAYFGLPLDVQIMLALLVIIVLLGPVASVLRNPRKAGRIGAYAGIGLFAAFGLPHLFAGLEPVTGDLTPFYGGVVLALWLAVRNILRPQRSGAE